MKFLLMKLIRVYQAVVRSGVATPFLFGEFSGCRSWPTCSEYAYSTVARDGVIRGGARAVRRILGCHSFRLANHNRA